MRRHLAQKCHDFGVPRGCKIKLFCNSWHPLWVSKDSEYEMEYLDISGVIADHIRMSVVYIQQRARNYAKRAVKIGSDICIST